MDQVLVLIWSWYAVWQQRPLQQIRNAFIWQLLGLAYTYRSLLLHWQAKGCAWVQQECWVCLYFTDWGRNWRSRCRIPIMLQARLRGFYSSLALYVVHQVQHVNQPTYLHFSSHTNRHCTQSIDTETLILSCTSTVLGSTGFPCSGWLVLSHGIYSVPCSVCSFNPSMHSGLNLRLAHFILYSHHCLVSGLSEQSDFNLDS